MKNFISWIALLALISLSHAQTLTHGEYFWNSDPGVGLATPIVFSSNDSISVPALRLSTAGLAAGPNKLCVRLRDNNGKWGALECKYLVIRREVPAMQIRKLTQYEYWVDNSAPTTVNTVDSAKIFEQLTLATAGLSHGIHSVHIRVQSDLGKWSEPELKYFVKDTLNPAFSTHFITDLEYFYDAQAPISADLTDTPNFSLHRLFSVAGLEIGPHSISFRCHSEQGIWSPYEKRVFLVITPLPQHGLAKYIAGAEYFVNQDPGAGLGVALPIPTDGNWDELSETGITMLTGLPVGYHLVGVRVKDNLGRWSGTETDTLLVGPLLTIRPAGNNIVLDWQADPSAIPFHVSRADSLSGTFNEIGTSDSLSYTDSGIVSTPSFRKYYQVSQTFHSFSSYRLPQLAEPHRE